MGSSTSRTFIENEVETFIQQQQKAIANIVTQSIINVTHKIVQEQQATITSSVGASNIFNGYQIIVKNGGRLSVNQQNYLKSTVEAILNLTQDNTLILNLSNDIKNDIKATLSQNADVSNKVSAAASMMKEQKNSGEVNGVISAVSDIATGALGALTTQETTNELRNKIIQYYAMKQESTTNLNNLIENDIVQNINLTTINNCISKSSIGNMINAKKIYIDGPTSALIMTQKNMLDTFYKCVISSTVRSTDLQTLSNSVFNNTSQDLSQSLSVKNDLSATVSSIDKKTATSWLDSLTGLVPIILIAIAVCVIIFLAAKYGGSKNTGQQLPNESLYQPSTMFSRAQAVGTNTAARLSKVVAPGYERPPAYDN
jgi:hypothetical protein